LLFEQRWDEDRGALRRSEVSLSDVSRAIRAVNPSLPQHRRLSDRNPANFFKDFIRNRASANSNWPASILERGYTARQTTGEGQCFEFVPLAEGQTEPFPRLVPEPCNSTARHRIESASLPLASRKLGRTDEPWLIQVAVRLRLIQTHLALFSPREILQVDHLQMSVKLRRTEIDAVFLAVEQVEDAHREVLVTCEAKTGRDDILPDQVLEQVRAVFDQRAITQNTVIPLAMKTVGSSEVYVVEFEPVSRAEIDAASELTVASAAIYELSPTVPGIGA